MIPRHRGNEQFLGKLRVGKLTDHGQRRGAATLEMELAGLEPATSWVR